MNKIVAKLKTVPAPTLIAGVVVIFWALSFILRQTNPEWTALGPAADAAVTTTVAWWMRDRAKRTGGDDLLSNLVNEVAMPRLAQPPAAPKPTPKPTQPPPKPAQPPKPGGLPWGS